MRVQQSPPARQTRSQARGQAVPTPTPRVSLDSTPAVPQLRLSRTTFKGTGEDGEEEEESDGTDSPWSCGGIPRYLRVNSSPVSHKSEPYLLAIMKQMTWFMANLQEASSSEASRPLAFKTPSMMVPECYDGTQTFKVRRFIQSCQFIFLNHPANFYQDRKKVLYATSYLIGRDEKWIKTSFSNLTNQDPNYLLSSCTLFESKLFNLFGDPKEVRKAEAKFYSLTMKDGCLVLFYISKFRILVSRIGEWGERDLIHYFKKGLPSSLFHQLASHPSILDE
ncbi:hypothetical protein O181_012480 [Austropuccinia psidii MF-1]|uniref:Retrotransposon gag domain-containing protein n=1 Tax=Austropuccinia psidii MF-1 TaxID=1389203 RepID=A0A9Q3GMZ7_9BASI|nr:hypothetical protein [Austropuccinia psidii MF-1]